MFLLICIKIMLVKGNALKHSEHLEYTFATDIIFELKEYFAHLQHSTDNDTGDI